MRRHEKEEMANLSRSNLSSHTFWPPAVLRICSFFVSLTQSLSFNVAPVFNASLPSKVKTFASHVIKGWVKASTLLTLVPLKHPYFRTHTLSHTHTHMHTQFLFLILAGISTHLFHLPQFSCNSIHSLSYAPSRFYMRTHSSSNAKLLSPNLSGTY